MFDGSCLCGAIAYQAPEPSLFFNHCHCSMCRKAHGAAFGTFLHTRAAGFRWVRGEEQVREFHSSPGNRRSFCATCGSNVPVVHRELDHAVIPAGTLDVDPGVRPSVNIFVASKAPWHEITDDLPRCDGYPPGME